VKREKLTLVISLEESVRQYVRSFSLCTYPCITPPNTVYLDCQSANVIYLLTCCNCGLQYVGETVMQLNFRFKGHRKGIKIPEKYGGCKILTTHFNEGICKGATYTVQIVEKLEGDSRTERRALDASCTAKRKSGELHWMLKLRTVFPYGLNDKIGSEYKVETRSCIARRFPPLTRNFSRISRRANRKSSNGLSAKDFYCKLQEFLVSNIKDSLNFIRVYGKVLSMLNV